MDYLPDIPSPTPVQAFLWRSGHRTLSPEALAELRATGAQLTVADWEQVAKLAGDDGMQSLVLQHSAAAGLLEEMPEAVSSSMLSAYRRDWIRNRHLRGEHARVIQTLSAAGIEIMPIKGVQLAERCYGELALRPILDLDLLVHRRDLPTIETMLAELGYLPIYGSSQKFDFYELAYNALVFCARDGEVIELHWQLANLPAYLPRLAVDDLWRRAVPIQFAGLPVHGLSSSDELRYLCFHYAAQHQSARLIWLVDIAEMVNTLPVGWEWQAFVDETIERGLATPVAVALDRAQHMLGTRLPAGILPQLRQASTASRERRAWSAAGAVFRRPDSLLGYMVNQSSAADRLTLARALALRAVRRWRRLAAATMARLLATTLGGFGTWGQGESLPAIEPEEDGGSRVLPREGFMVIGNGRDK
jgi:hypothetical protein